MLWGGRSYTMLEIIKAGKIILDKLAEPQVPPKHKLIVVWDSKSAKLAAERTVEYAVSNGHKAECVPADIYRKYRLKAISNQNKVIIIGHHSIAEEEKLKAVCKYGKCHGMTYGRSVIIGLQESQSYQRFADRRQEVYPKPNFIKCLNPKFLLQFFYFAIEVICIRLT